MSTHVGNDNIRSTEIGVNTLYCTVTFGSSGAVTTSDGKGVTITKPSGTGLYRATFDDTFKSLLHASFTHHNGGTAIGDLWEIKTDLSGKAFDFQCLADTGAAANATSGNKVLIKFEMKYSGV